MFQLAAVFSPGFEKVIPGVLTDVLPDASNVQVSSGFVRFTLNKNPVRAVNADFVNNSFLVLKEWKKAPSFEVMANKIRVPEQFLPEITKQHYKTFRLRFSNANVFTSVNKNIISNVEKTISQQTGMKPDRLGGDTEFWFLTRTDGYGCFALRLTKKQSTEKYLEKGELRPEFVTLLAAFADPENKLKSISNPVIMDPFAGHGGIVKRLKEIYPSATILSSELDPDLAKKIKGCVCCDAANLNHISDNSVDAVITDPPWGFWQGDLRDDDKLKKLYAAMIKEMERVAKPGASFCVLTAAKEVFESVCPEAERNDVLVNGKKSAVYVWTNSGI